MSTKLRLTLLLLFFGTFITTLFFLAKLSEDLPVASTRPEVFLAAVASEPVSEKETTLMFVGDIMLSRNIGLIMEREGDWHYPFQLIQPFLKTADFLFGNLEGSISNRGIKSGSLYPFRADPRAIEGLIYADLDALSLANNHIWDYGSIALTDTLTSLEDAQIGFTGAGEDFEEAYRPLITRVGDVVVATFSYTNLLPTFLGRITAKPAVALFDLEIAKQKIAEIRTNTDVVAISLHWGEEYETESNRHQKEIAYALIDAGADLIIGHHPHVVQEVERYKEGYIVYSLGNFIFDQNFSEDTGQGLILIVDMVGKNISSVYTRTIKFNESFQPFVVK